MWLMTELSKEPNNFDDLDNFHSIKQQGAGIPNTLIIVQKGTN